MTEQICDESFSSKYFIEGQQGDMSLTRGHPSAYRLILHNDDRNTMDYVADTVFQVTVLKPFESHQKMLEANQDGAACLLVTDKEKAEHYRDQFVSKGLSVTIEPVTDSP